MATQPRRLRADDLSHINPEDPAISGFELVDGELVPVMPANPHHAELIVEVGALLRSVVKDRQRGRVFADPWIRLERCRTCSPSAIRCEPRAGYGIAGQRSDVDDIDRG